ncbi:MAG: hypothetical protein KDA42_10540 [Planctomycetales bacterium]|nr:hypothetical protein [Planctomycetales bacterium]
MESTEAWRDCFTNWPDEVPRRGILVTGYAEQVAFDAFYTNPEFLLITRNAPDALGARQLIIRYSDISALKITDVVPPKAWSKLGFAGATKRASGPTGDRRQAPPRPS